MEYRLYNTGDQIWTSERYGKPDVTIKIVTNDGITWSEEDDRLVRLEGIEMAVHRLFIWMYTNLLVSF